MLLPFVALLVAEGGLRLAGYGQTQPLFYSLPRLEGYLLPNPRVIQRFMTDEAETPNLRIRPVAFRAEKAPETFRIFVQGGSTAAGYPYGYGASPAGMLQQRLQRTFPDRRIEVITTAVSAVNSYTLRDFSPEILEREPDAVVIYAGHNEYLGLLGVGSSFSAGRRRPLVLSFLALHDLRVVQLARNAVAAVTPSPVDPDDPDDPDPEGEPGNRRRSLMERVVAKDRIPYGSGLYRRGLAQYRANLGDVLEGYREAGVPVFVGTLVANERDQPPFVSGNRRGVDLDAWRERFDAGLASLRADDPAAALEALDAAIALDDLHADVHFARGRALEALERWSEAREAYLAARDRDELRFRAPRVMNDILREVATEHGAHVVEVEEAFVRASEHGIVGREHMLEHLHPNVEGYFVMGSAFYDAFREQGLIGAWERPVPDEQARREMPVTEVDRLYGEYRIRRLVAGWPFSDGDGRYEPPAPESREERIAQNLFAGAITWPDAMRRLLDHYRAQGDFAEAAKVAVLLADAHPYRPDDQQTAARLLLRAGRDDFPVYERRVSERPSAIAGNR